MNKTYLNYLVEKVVSENGNGHKYLKRLVEVGDITETEEKTILVLANLRVAENRMDEILKVCA